MHYGLTFVMAYWSLFGLFAGLSSEKLDKDRRVRPNEGIRRSLRISVSVGLSSGLVCMLIGILSTMLYFGLYAWLGQGLTIGVNLGLHAGFSNALYGGLWTGVVVGLQVGIFGALLAGAPMGGLAYLRHYVLRCLLWRSHKIPFNYSRFLDRAAECILLRKVGGGYMFIHREFQDYMASFCSCGYKDDRQYVQFCPFCGKRRYNGR